MKPTRLAGGVRLVDGERGAAIPALGAVSEGEPRFLYREDVRRAGAMLARWYLSALQ